VAVSVEGKCRPRDAATTYGVLLSAWNFGIVNTGSARVQMGTDCLKSGTEAVLSDCEGMSRK
jgi:hypothetical protein